MSKEIIVTLEDSEFALLESAETYEELIVNDAFNEEEKESETNPRMIPNTVTKADMVTTRINSVIKGLIRSIKIANSRKSSGEQVDEEMKSISVETTVRSR